MTLRLKGSNSGDVSLKAPATAGDNTITLPTSNGSAEQFLKNSGTAGELEFSSMVETSTGVGIGETSPSHKCQIAGTLAVDSFNDTTKTITLRPGYEANANGGMGLVAKDHSGAAADGLGVYGTDGISLHTANAGTFYERIRVDTSGRLLVGTSSAREHLNDGSDSAQVFVQGTTQDTSTLAVIRSSDNDGPAHLVLGKARGTGSGSTTIVQSGDTIGHINFEGADGSHLIRAGQISCVVDATPGANDMPGRLVFKTCPDGSNSLNERMRIDKVGRIYTYGAYDTTTNSAANVNIASDGILRRSTSSAKYKTNIETLNDSFSDALLACRPVWYRSTCEGDNPDHSWWGFIAEEVAEIDPRLVHWKTTEVTYDENGSVVESPCDPEPEGVAYDRFVPHLVNLVKRQKATITAQQAQIDDLLARVTALEAA